MGKHAPSTAAAQDVEDGIEDRPEIRGSRSAPRLGGRKQATDGIPFGVTEVTWVSHRRTLARLLDLSKHPLRNGNDDLNLELGGTPVKTNPAGGNETRPKNAYIMY